MKVAELIAELQACDPDAVVILQRDMEGNGYSPLAYIWAGVYVAGSDRSGDVWRREQEIDPDARAQGFGDDELYGGDDGLQAIVLCPEE